MRSEDNLAAPGIITHATSLDIWAGPARVDIKIYSRGILRPRVLTSCHAMRSENNYDAAGIRGAFKSNFWKILGFRPH